MARCVACPCASCSRQYLFPTPLGNALAADGGDSPPETPAIVAPPNAAALKQATELAKQVFQADIEGAKTPAAKLELARKLLQQASDSTDDPPGRLIHAEHGSGLCHRGGRSGRRDSCD